MVPSWLQAIILGIVQGVTEFVPVSSSGHLVLVPHLLGWERPGLAFDVALHLGTAAAIILYFRVELSGMVVGFLRGRSRPEGVLYRRLAALLGLGSVPVVVVGFLARDWFERVFETPTVAASFLFVTAGVLIFGERLRTRRVRRDAAGHDEVRARRGARVGPPAACQDTAALPDVETGHDSSDPRGVSLDRMRVRHALVVGSAQCLALFPGLSRSGATITAGIAAGLTRTAATRYSFLLALPAMLGAALVSLPDLAEPGPYSGVDIVAGVVASGVAGYLAIAFLVRLVARAGLTVFVRYLLVAGTVGILAAVFVGAPA